MNINTAIKKIDLLTDGELMHCVQRMDVDIKNYKRVCQFYSPYKMKRFAVPHISRLENMKQQFEKKLAENRKL